MKAGRFRLLTSRPLGLAGVATALLLAVLAAAAAGRTIVATDGPNGILTVDSVAGKVVGAPIATGRQASAVAISPDGRFAYVAVPDASLSNVSVVDLRTRQLVGGPIRVGEEPGGIAVSPDGSRVYVVSSVAGTVSEIDPATGKVEGEPIEVGERPSSIAIAPDGATAYVTNEGSNTVSVLDLRAHAEVGTAIPVEDEPQGIAITPDGKTVYVANHEEQSVSVIDTAKGAVASTIKPAVSRPTAIAIAPDGSTAYVSGFEFGEVAVIDTRSNTILKTLDTGAKFEGIAIDPAGRTVYVSDSGDGGLTRIDSATRQVVGSPIEAGKGGGDLAFVPDQGPLARFTAPRVRPGVPTFLDASSSADPDGKVARYAWSFGDGGKANGAKAKQSHTFRKPGSYTVRLQVTDEEGCSTALIFTGQTALCNGSRNARTEKTVTVAFPGVRASCPRSAGRRGCNVRLQAVSAKRKPKIQSAAASVKLKAGEAEIVSLHPTPRFRGRLATAGKILAKVTVRTATSTRTKFTRLKVVQ